MRVAGWFTGVVLFSLASSTSGARAGAFPQREGEGQIIATSVFTDTTRTFDASGKLIPIDQYKKYELGVYIEYGAADWITLILKPTLSRVYKEGPPQGLYSGLGSVEAGARVKIAQYESIVFSAQALVHVPGSRDQDNPALAGNTGYEFDARLLAGIPFELAGMPGFADAQIAYRSRGGDPPNEIRLDLTLGARPVPRLLLMLQSFNIVAPQAGAPGFPAMRQHKLQASGVWDVSGGWSIQAGLFTTVASRNARREHGFLSGVWRRF